MIPHGVHFPHPLNPLSKSHVCRTPGSMFSLDDLKFLFSQISPLRFRVSEHTQRYRKLLYFLRATCILLPLTSSPESCAAIIGFLLSFCLLFPPTPWAFLPLLQGTLHIPNSPQICDIPCFLILQLSSGSDKTSSCLLISTIFTFLQSLI